ncbi:MAG: hypothetical protein NZT61_07425 [Deltaproteobacteria bacterium]|nr:hypothetical protein [Deltaproteobacteria bacterium]
MPERVYTAEELSRVPRWTRYLETTHAAETQKKIMVSGHIPEILIEVTEPRQGPFALVKTSEGGFQFLALPLNARDEILHILSMVNSRLLTWGFSEKTLYLNSLFLARTACGYTRLDCKYTEYIFRQPASIIVFGFLGLLEKLLDKPLGEAFGRLSGEIREFVSNVEQTQFGSKNQNRSSEELRVQMIELLDEKTRIVEYSSEFAQRWKEALDEFIRIYNSGGKSEIFGLDFSRIIQGRSIDSNGETLDPQILPDLLRREQFANCLDRFISLFETYRATLERHNSSIRKITAEKIGGISLELVDSGINVLRRFKQLIQSGTACMGHEFHHARKYDIAEFLYEVLITVNTYLCHAYYQNQFNNPQRSLHHFQWYFSYLLISINLLKTAELFPNFNLGDHRRNDPKLLSSLTKKHEWHYYTELFFERELPDFSSKALSSVSRIIADFYANTDRSSQRQESDLEITVADVIQEFFVVTLNEMKRVLILEPFDENFFYSLFCASLNARLGLYATNLSENLHQATPVCGANRDTESDSSKAHILAVQTDVLPIVGHYLHSGVLASKTHRIELANMIDHALKHFIHSEFDSLESFLAYLRFRLSNSELSLDHPVSTSVENMTTMSFENAIKILAEALGGQEDLSECQFYLVPVLTQAREALRSLGNQDTPTIVLFTALYTVIDWLTAYSMELEPAKVYHEIDEKDLDRRKLAGYLSNFLLRFESVINNPSLIHKEYVDNLVRALEALGVSKLELIEALNSVSFRVTHDRDMISVRATVRIQDLEIEHRYNFKLLDHRRISASKSLVLNRVSSAFSKLLIQILGEGRSLIQEAGLSIEETLYVLNITNFDSLKTSRAAQIIRKIGYKEFVNLHEKCNGILEELLTMPKFDNDSEVVATVVEMLKGLIPDSIPAARYVDRKRSAVKKKIVTAGENRSQRVKFAMTEYFRHLFADMTIFQALAGQHSIRHITEQLEIYRQLSFTVDEVLHILASNKLLLDWNSFFPETSFKTFWNQEFEDFLLWLDVTNQDDIRDLIVTYPELLEPGLNKRVQELITLYAQLFESDEKANVLAASGVRRCKELLLHRKEEVETRLLWLSGLILGSTMSGNPESMDDLRRIQQQILIHVPELLFYSGDVTRFRQILGLGLEAIEKKYLEKLDPYTLKRLNSFNPIVIRLAIDIFQDLNMSESFLIFVDRLNAKLREFFGLSKGQFIGPEIANLLNQIGYERLKAQVKILLGIFE